MSDAHRRSQLASWLLLLLAAGLFIGGVAARTRISVDGSRALRAAVVTFQLIDSADQMALNLTRAELDQGDPPPSTPRSRACGRRPRRCPAWRLAIQRRPGARPAPKP
jgi:hypothetical protein